MTSPTPDELAAYEARLDEHWRPRDELAFTLQDVICCAPEAGRRKLAVALAEYRRRYPQVGRRAAHPPLLAALFEAIEDGLEEASPN